MSSRAVRSCFVLIVCLSFGCQPSLDTPTEAPIKDASLEVVSGSQLRKFVRDSELPVLVEFGVDYNCPRCQQVKTDVVALSERLDDRVKMVRVDFSANAGLVAQLGGTICPTYVLFQNGDPVLTRSFPISIDLLEGEVEKHNDSQANRPPAPHE